MIARIVGLSIRYAVVVVALALVLVCYGLYTLTRADLNVFPEFSPSQVVIQTEAPGLSTELVEAQVTARIEAALAGLTGIQSLRSQSIPGLSVVTLIFGEQETIFRKRQLVTERLSQLAAQLPTGIGPPAMTPLTSSASTVLGVGLTSDARSLIELRSLVDWTVRPHLLSVAGVADVNVFGGAVRQWQVQVDPQRLVTLGLSVQDVLAAVRGASGVLGTGFVEGDNQRIVIAAEGQPRSPSGLAEAVVVQREGRVVRIRDVADVVEGPAPTISAALIDGKPGVFLMVQGQLGANVRSTTQQLEAALQELKPLFAAEKVTFHPRLFRPANFIETAVANVQRDILIGSVLVIAVLFLFLYNTRTAFICATAIPVSLLGAVLVLDSFGIDLNIMVLGGLAIALGEVVDDAIIDTENIFRRLRQNREQGSPLSATKVVLNASLEVRSSVVYATFIVALVFVPLLTLSGVAGKLFAPLGLAYIFAILVSLVVAMTLTPALCSLLLAHAPLKEADPPLIRWIKPRYARLLTRVERHPARVVGIVGLVLATGVGMLPFFSGEFIPALKEGHYIIHMTAVPGTSQQESLRIGKRVTAELLRIEGVQSVVQWVGRAERGADTFGVHYSEFEVEIGALPGREQTRILNAIRGALSGNGGRFPGVSFVVNTFLTERIEETITGYAAGMAVNLFGSNLDSLDRDAQAVARVLASVPGARDVQLQAPPGTPQLSVRLRPDLLANWGLSSGTVLEVIQAAYQGTTAGRIFRDNQVVNAVVVLPPELRRSIAQVRDLILRNPEGRMLRLGDVAEVEITSGRYKVLHYGGKRLQTVTGNVAGRDLGDFEREVKSRIAEQVRLSPGNFLTFSGTAEAQARARGDLIAHSLLAGVGIFVLLYVAFNNLRNLGITFLNLPFALVGGVIAVLGTGGWLSLGSMVGFVTLFGITLRNSIMLVSHYQYLIEFEGATWSKETALRGAQERLPSILMTALVTALGLLPLALGSGQPGREIEGPMATIIVGGLVTSTLLNLVILPTVLLHYGRFGTASR
ncbi:MAG: efflux RND transporter permease subunit [Burkholderiales bacterium]